MARMLILLLLVALASPVLANEAVIRKVVEAKLGGTKVDGIQPGPMGLFEVRFRSPRGGPQIIYTDATATYIFSGQIFEAKTDRNLTDERLQKLLAIKFDALPLDLAVKVVRGGGKRTLAVFSDPYCPYCKRFEAELAKLDNVTIYYYLYPVIRPELADHSKSAWCSKDRVKAWLDLAQYNRQPSAPANCANPIDKVLELGRSLDVGSTPTVFVANGERLPAGMSAEKLNATLDTVHAELAKAK